MVWHNHENNKSWCSTKYHKTAVKQDLVHAQFRRMMNFSEDVSKKLNVGYMTIFKNNLEAVKTFTQHGLGKLTYRQFHLVR